MHAKRVMLITESTLLYKTSERPDQAWKFQHEQVCTEYPAIHFPSVCFIKYMLNSMWIILS